MKFQLSAAGARALYTAACILFCIGAFIITLAGWLQQKYNLTYQQFLFTLTSPLEGADNNIVLSSFKACIPAFLIMLAFALVNEAALKLRKNYNITAQVKIFKNRVINVNIPALVLCCSLVIGAALFTVSVLFANRTLKVTDYYERLKHPTTLYENYYIDPKTVLIKAPENKKNLLLIYMESMETTFASVEEGGRQPVNYIPNLTQLAKDNYSFSNTQLLGGTHSLPGSTWTMGALFSTSSGIPFSFPTKSNGMRTMQYFATGTTVLGDILAENGYSNLFLCGSDADFGGRRKFFEQHGGYRIYDYFSAKQDKYIAQDYKVFWGFEDQKLYRIAKDLLPRMAQEDKPFNFTMLTVDTHFTGGYICELCGNTYEERLGNVFSCADNQLFTFLEWCKTQSFYDDTVIVVMGDHPTMEVPIIDGIPFYDRTVYNCFINPVISQNEIKLKERQFTPMDMFPTILSALGFKIEGDKLGLGTDLFSGKPTLIETMGHENLEKEITSYSAYYVEKFK